MGLKAAVQALKKAEPLKDKVQRCKDLLNDSDAWLCQQQLQKIYQQVLILDLEYALDRKVEQELWNLGFKNYIATLQALAKDRKNPKRGESQAMLSWCLEAASGFYLTLLQEICTAFNLDLPFRRKNNVYGYISQWKAVVCLTPPHKSSCFYICQHCLVHLGDIARYRNQNKQAELFYRHAVSLSPSSGQPYNQLALLDASRGDKLGTVFHYIRSVAVKHPFPVATANLTKTLSTALNDTSYCIEGKTKLSSEEYVAIFLKFHGVLHNLGDLSAAKKYVKLLNETLTALVATESFSSWRLTQMLVINLFALHHTAGVSTENLDLLKVDQLSSDEMISRNCILDLIAGSLSALLLPVYTIKSELINYFALPTIKLCLEWISLWPQILEEEAFESRLQIWPSLCVLLNGLLESVADFEYNLSNKIPLPEDRDLQGFLTLDKHFETLRFSQSELEKDITFLNKLRSMRIVNIGRKISEFFVNDTQLITIHNANSNEREKFSTSVEATGLCCELMKELEELSLNKEKHFNISNSPGPSESVSSKGSLEMDGVAFDYSMEKKVGILKSQNSTEKNHDVFANSPEIGNVEISNTHPTARKPRQNIAMQAIMRRAETEQKQVTFKNTSPEDAQVIEKNKAEILSEINVLQPAANLNLNSLVQNHPSSNLNSAIDIQGSDVPLIKNQQLVSPECSFQNSSSYQQYHLIPQNISPSYCAADPKFNQNYLNNTTLSQQFPVQGKNIMPQGMSNISPTQLMIGKVNQNIIGMQQGIILPQNSTFNIGNLKNDVELIRSISANGSTCPSNFNYNNIEKQFIFPTQNNSFPAYHNNYETKDYNPWKDPQPPQPPVSWWEKNSGQTLQNNTASLCTNAFQNWANSSVAENKMVGSGSNYQQNPVNGVVYNNRAVFDGLKQFDCEKNQKLQERGSSGNTYSLFSENNWNSVQYKNPSDQDQMTSHANNQQSLWSGPGPSPLERLLEQQKSLREGGT